MDTNKKYSRDNLYSRFDNLLGIGKKPQEDIITPTSVDKRDAVCPYCGSILDKIPGAKTKCKACGNYMYVRTNLARERLVVTEEQADEIDKEWHYHTLKDYFTQEELENETTRLAKQFGKSPNISDVLRGLYNQKRMFYHDYNYSYKDTQGGETVVVYPYIRTKRLPDMIYRCIKKGDITNEKSKNIFINNCIPTPKTYGRTAIEARNEVVQTIKENNKNSNLDS